MFPTLIQSHLLGHLTTAVLVLEEDLRVAYSNSSAEMLFEVSGQRSRGTHIQKILHESNDPLTGLEECIKTGQSFTQREVELYTLNGNRITVDYTVKLVAEKNRTFLVMEIYARDRLQRISREEDLLSKQESSRMLIRGLAHEIKNPLGGIRGAAQLLDKELTDNDRDYTRIIIEEADRLRNLVDRMLGPNRFLQREPVNIHEILERVVNLIEVESGGDIMLIRDYDPSIPEIIGDKEQLIQALLNISRNALQALTADVPTEQQRVSSAHHRVSTEQPKLATDQPTITFRSRPLRQFTIGQIRHRLVIRLEVIDNGPGVARDMQNSIFYPMVSCRPEGSGLGLSITQSIISQHQGLVECESEPGKTNFIIFIPLEPKL